MNRRKKIVQIFNSKVKKAQSKATSNKKPKYISKADRAKLEEESKQGTAIIADDSSKSMPE